MPAEIYHTSNSAPDEKAISRCAEVIKHGGIVVFPTETVYGIGVNAFDEQAISRLYRVKKRPLDKPLLCHINGLQAAEALGFLDDTARKLIARYTPGPLTLVVKRKKELPDMLVSGGETVGLRFPSNGIFIALAQKCGMAIAATSANISGSPSAKTGNELSPVIDIADAVIDGGACEYALESTILSLVGKPVILRQGAFPRELIEEVIGKCE